MRKNLIAMLTVAAVSVGICVFSQIQIENAVDEMDKMRMEVMDLAENGDTKGAEAGLGRMAERWIRYEGILEMIAQHEQLQEITELIIESDANLTAEDSDDFRRSMHLLGEAIRHLMEEEKLKLTNVL